MLPAIEARPFSSVSGVTPRFDCRICSIEETAASGLDTSWHTAASMKPSEARRCVWRRNRVFFLHVVRLTSARSSIGTHSAAATTESAIARVHTGR